MPLLLQPPQLPAQQMPRREMERHAAVEIFVAQNPADARRPRQHAKGRGIGHDGEVGRAGHLGEAHAAAARERGEGARVGGIERRGGDVDVVAVGQRGDEGRHGHRLGARGAVRVGPGEPHELQVFLLDPQLELLGLPALLVGPEAVLFDEIWIAWRAFAAGYWRYSDNSAEPIGFDQTFLSATCAQTLDLSHPRPHPSWRQSAGRPLRQGPKGRRGGKSGLHGRTVPDNVRRGPFSRKREPTSGKVPQRADRRVQSRKGAAARVKGCGKSAPRRRQRRRHGKPHREQDRIGTARSESSGIDVRILPSG